jgi:hypothetical protein
MEGEMTSLLTVAAIGAIGFLAGSAWMEAHNAPADKVVIIDGWWAKDYAKSSGASDVLVNPAVPFLQEVGSDMALDHNCAGVRVAYVWSPQSTTKETLALEQGSHKMLIVDYVAGSDRPYRAMDGMSGQGSAKEIAADVCYAMSGNGAHIASY